MTVRGQKTILFLATAGGLGRLPAMPGTWGSLPGLPLAWGLGFLPPFWSAAILVALIVLAAPVAGAAADIMGRADPHPVVIDEVVGMAVALWAVPISAVTLFGGFLLFRAADVAKPWPIRAFERLPGGLGIVADDVVAGIVANLALRLAAWVAW